MKDTLPVKMSAVLLDFAKPLLDKHYGSDYFELVEYYAEKGDALKAVEYAHQGLDKSNGLIDHLRSYLLDYYKDKKQY